MSSLLRTLCLATAGAALGCAGAAASPDATSGSGGAEQAAGGAGGGSSAGGSSATGSPAGSGGAEDDGSHGLPDGALPSCWSDADCRPEIAQWTDPDVDMELTQAVCQHTFDGVGRRTGNPGCQCFYRRSVRLPGREPALEESYFTLGIDDAYWAWGFSPPTCALSADVPGAGCLQCATEFAGCHEADRDGASDECSAQCQAAIDQRLAVERTPRDAELRLGRCSESRSCETVLRVSDACYNQDWVPASCQLDDASIVATSPADPYASSCTLPELPCSTASDCPRGLGCNGSVCGPCYGGDECWSVNDENGVSAGCLGEGFACLDGEQCVLGSCVPEAQAACSGSAPCPSLGESIDPRVCLLSGVDSGSARGNEQTQSYCAPPMPNCYGLAVGDVLELTLLDPSQAPPAEFVPPLDVPQDLACGDGIGPGTGATLLLELDGFGAGTPCLQVQGHALSELGARTNRSAAHPRDPAEGRAPATLLNAPSNYAIVASIEEASASIAGCEGTRRLELISQLLPPDEQRAALATGAFPPSVLGYYFTPRDDGSPACQAALPSGSCRRYSPVRAVLRE